MAGEMMTVLMRANQAIASVSVHEFCGLPDTLQVALQPVCVQEVVRTKAAMARSWHLFSASVYNAYEADLKLRRSLAEMGLMR